MYNLSVRVGDSSDPLPPDGGVSSISGQMRSEHHLQSAEGAALVATCNRPLETLHHQPNHYLIGPGQSQSRRHVG